MSDEFRRRRRLGLILVVIMLALSTIACDCLSEAYAQQHPDICDGRYAPHPTPRPTITPALVPVPLQ